MNYVKQFLANAKASPKTTAIGLAGIATAGVALKANWALIGNPTWWTGLIVSVGLLFAPDQKTQQ